MRPPPTPEAFRRPHDGDSPMDRLLRTLGKKPQPAMEEFRDGVAALRRAARLDPETFETMVDRMLRPIGGSRFEAQDDDEDEGGESMEHGPSGLSEDNRFGGPHRRD